MGKLGFDELDLLGANHIGLYEALPIGSAAIYSLEPDTVNLIINVDRSIDTLIIDGCLFLRFLKQSIPLGPIHDLPVLHVHLASEVIIVYLLTPSMILAPAVGCIKRVPFAG